MATHRQGLQGPIGFSVETETVLYPVVREVFVNEAPLVTRLPRVPAAGEVFSMVTYDVRQRTGVTLNAAIANNTVTTVTLTDNTSLQIGDVIEVGTERMLVTAVDSAGANVTVVRGHESTTAAAANNAAAVTLLYNSRTGAEVDVDGNRMIRTAVEQYVQTFQFPVQVSGKANASQNIVLPTGPMDIFSAEQQIKLTEMIRDEEYAVYYGKGYKPASVGDRAVMKGLRYLIATANVKTNGGASYTKASFITDGLQKVYSAGGNPDVIICSTDFMGGLATWSAGAERRVESTPVLGLPINQFYVPLIGNPITFIPSLQLASGTAIILTSSDLRLRVLRNEFWSPRGKRGDAWEGDFICDLALELGHPTWHAWVSGISSYA